MGLYSKHLYHPNPSAWGGGSTLGLNEGYSSRLYRLQEFDAATLTQMASQLGQMVPDVSTIAPMLATAGAGMVGNYVSSRLGKVNPMEKIETALHKKLDNTKVGRWVNGKLDQASDYMDRKLGIGGLNPEVKAEIGKEVTNQLDARGVSRNGNHTSAPPAPIPPSTPSSSPSTATSRPSTPPSTGNGGNRPPSR